MSTRNLRESGFTLIESAISLAIFTFLVTALLSLSVKTTRFVSLSEADAEVQLEGNQTFARLTEILRKSGRVVESGIVYPRTIEQGKVLQFRILDDVDGDGYPFSANGDLEWHPDVFEIRGDEEGTLSVYLGTTRVHHLGRFVDMDKLLFETIEDNSDLDLNEIGVTFETRRTADDDVEVVYPVSGTIYMRN